ncbi:MAG TPA: alpha-E domain-containing protein [Polyangia bacterium]
MISRVADHCFWFGRYMDRAESTARLLQVTRTLVFDADIPVTQCWKPLVIVSGEHPALIKRHGEEAAGDGEVVQSYMTWDADNLVSLQSSVRGARENARVIRDVLSLETWEEVNELYIWLGSDAAAKLYAENREQFYRHVRRATQLVLGLVRSTMLHDRPMSFLWLGVMLERVGQTARTLDMNHHTMTLEAEHQHQIVEVALLLSLLRACSGYEAFAKKSQGRATAKDVTSFLLFDRQFPRSLRYCLRAARRILTDIWPEAAAGGIGSKSYGRCNSLLEWLDGREASFTTGGLHNTLTRVVDDTAALCSFVAQEMLGPPRPTRAKKTVLELAQSQSQSHTETPDQGQTQHQG